MRTLLSTEFCVEFHGGRTRRRCVKMILAGLLAFAPVASSQEFGSPRSFGTGTPTRILSTISGTVLLENGRQPVDRIQIRIRRASGAPSITTYTGPNGNFEASDLPGGRYIVYIDEPGFQHVEETVDTDGGATSVAISLKRVTGTNGASAGPVKAVVPVQDLKVPSKARHAFQKGLSVAEKHPTESIAFFRQATEIYPQYYSAYEEMAMAQLRASQYQDAEATFQKAIDVSEGHIAEPQLALGGLMVGRHDFSGAERVLRRGIDVDSSSWKGYFFLAEAQWGMRRLDDAVKSAHEAIRRNPTVPAVFALLADIDLEKRDYPSALTDVSSFLRLRPTGPESDQARAIQQKVEGMVAKSKAGTNEASN